MYRKIERNFSSKSKYKNIMSIFAIYVLSYAVIMTLFINKFNFKVIYPLIIAVIIFYMIIYLYMYKIVNKDINEKWSIIFNMLYIIDKFFEVLHKNDLNLLIEVLLDNKINTRPKVLEAVRHYQAYVPRRIIAGGNLLSILALTISILALILSDKGGVMITRLEIIIPYILMVIVLYLMVKSINSNILKSYSRNEFYIRLEELMSEIYMDKLIK